MLTTTPTTIFTTMKQQTNNTANKFNQAYKLTKENGKYVFTSVNTKCRIEHINVLDCLPKNFGRKIRKNGYVFLTRALEYWQSHVDMTPVKVGLTHRYGVWQTTGIIHKKPGSSVWYLLNCRYRTQDGRTFYFDFYYDSKKLSATRYHTSQFITNRMTDNSRTITSYLKMCDAKQRAIQLAAENARILAIKAQDKRKQNKIDKWNDLLADIESMPLPPNVGNTLP